MYRNGNAYGNTQATNVVMKKFFLIESDGYQDQYIRPYNMEAGYEDLNKVKDIVTRSVQLNSVGNIGQEVSNSISNILTPSSMVIGAANIAGEGWGSKRFKFVMLIEESSNTSNSVIINYVQGYTDQLGISYKDTLDPNMRFFVNTVNVLRKTFDRNTGGFSIVPVKSYNSVHDELNMLDYADTRFVPNSGPSYTPDHEALKLARPEDILVNASTLSAADSDTMIFSSVGTVNNFNIVDNEDILPTQHLSKTISSAVSNSMNDSAFTDDVDMYGNLQNSNVINAMLGDTLSCSAEQITIFKMILRTTGSLRPNMSLSEINDMFAPAPVVPDVMLGNDVAIRTGGTTTPYELSGTETENTYGADIETRKSVLVHEAVITTLNDSLLSHIVFEIDNMTGQPLCNILHAGSEIEGLNTIAYSNKFTSMFMSRIWNSLSENNMIQVKILVSSLLVSDTTISISIDGRPPVVYRYPTFANSKYLPIIMNNENLDDLSRSYTTVISEAITSSKEAMSNASRF